MGENSTVPFTHHTWNPWRGCTHALLKDGTSHPGCRRCYAERMAARNPTVLGIWGDDGTRPIGTEEYQQHICLGQGCLHEAQEEKTPSASSAL